MICSCTTESRWLLVWESQGFIHAVIKDAHTLPAQISCSEWLLHGSKRIGSYIQWMHSDDMLWNNWVKVITGVRESGVYPCSLKGHRHPHHTMSYSFISFWYPCPLAVSEGMSISKCRLLKKMLVCFLYFKWLRYDLQIKIFLYVRISR